MKKTLRILVADRNRHVRHFLKRELEADYHEVQTVSSISEIIGALRRKPRPDLFILDSFFTGPDAPLQVDRILTDFKNLPVILHIYNMGEDVGGTCDHRLIIIEKKGNSIEKIKKVVKEIQSSLLHVDAV